MDEKFVDQTTGGVGTAPFKGCSRRRTRKVSGHSGGNKNEVPINVGRTHWSEQKKAVVPRRLKL